MKIGDPLILFNGDAYEYSAVIKKISKKEIVLAITSKKEVNKESPLKITIAQSIPKGQKMDEMIPRLTELGMYQLIPLLTERGNVRTLGKEKINRWKKIAIQSAQQTGRTVVSYITEPYLFKKFLEKFQDKKKILLYELENSRSFKEILEPIKQPSELFFIIGPEGGFSPSEISMAIQHKCDIVSLGQRILRTETVAPAVTAIAQYCCGDVGVVK